MTNRWRLTLLFLAFIRLGDCYTSSAGESNPTPLDQSFADWRAACASLPSNRVMMAGAKPPAQFPLKTFAEFETVLNTFYDLCSTNDLARSENWVGAPPSRQDFFNRHRAYFDDASVPFEPFTQKLLLPADAEVILHGDFHGDIHSLIGTIDALNQSNYLSGFKIIRPNTYLLFLGDYTDRGFYGVEVITTLLRLKLANPDHVYMVRGNHEDISLAARYGFLAEGQKKYGAAFNPRKVCRLYDFLPVAIYLGCGTNYAQCCHGGMEPGYSPAALLAAPGNLKYQLLGRLAQQSVFQSNPERFKFLEDKSRSAVSQYWQDFTPQNPITPLPIGFMWNDFTTMPGEAQFDVDAGRAFVYGDQTTRVILEIAGGAGNRIRTVFRAHQHSPQLNPMMRRLIASHGAFQHWQPQDKVELSDAPEAVLKDHLDRAGERAIRDGSVWTFNVAPDSVYGIGTRFDFDTFGILVLKDDFSAWRLCVINQTARK